MSLRVGGVCVVVDGVDVSSECEMLDGDEKKEGI